METILLISLFFGPPILASYGVGYRGAWFGYAAFALMLTLASCLGSWSMAMGTGEVQALEDASNAYIIASSWLGVAFLGCLLAGFFYREKQKSNPSNSWKEEGPDVDSKQ